MNDSRFIYSIAGLALCIVLYLLGKMIIRVYGRMKNLKVRRQEILSKFLLFVSFVAFLLLLVSVWGIEIKNIWIFITSFLGFFGIVLFASWSILSNIVSAFVLFFTVPFHTGDVIEIRDIDLSMQGVIEDLTLFYIFVRTTEGKVIIIPNNIAMQRIIVRHSRKKSPSSETP